MPPTSLPPRLEVLPASLEEAPILANLIELYAHDFSELRPLELGADGRFGYPRLPLYWREPGRHPFLVRLDGKLAGFVLVKRGSEVYGDPEVWDLAEFFVVRGYRRLGLGTRIAHEVWRRFPGSWEIRVMEANRSAEEFWKRAISAFISEPVLGADFEKDAERWRLYSFEA